MNDSERVALAWISRHLHLLECSRCSGRWVVRRSLGVLFHRCSPPRRRGLEPTWSREAYIAEQRQRWAERELGASPITEAIEHALGDRALRGGSEEELQLETGQSDSGPDPGEGEL